MTRREFTQEVVDSVLFRCRRHWCVCGKYCGTKIELHHIEGHDNNNEGNALPCCFDCHAEIGRYNSAHPRGRKYQPAELKRLREATFKRFEANAVAPRSPGDPADSVVSRFVRLFETHGVHRNQIPRFLGVGLSVRDVQDDASLIDKLDAAGHNQRYEVVSRRHGSGSRRIS
jgi:hypothetical protein